MGGSSSGQVEMWIRTEKSKMLRLLLRYVPPLPNIERILQGWSGEGLSKRESKWVISNEATFLQRNFTDHFVRTEREHSQLVHEMSPSPVAIFQQGQWLWLKRNCIHAALSGDHCPSWKRHLAKLVLTLNSLCPVCLTAARGNTSVITVATDYSFPIIKVKYFRLNVYELTFSF